MEYLALYRKYRPKELDEVVGQSEIKQILASSIVSGTITHAYLFSGPRGTGKTTMAKILAKMVNCESPVNGNACNKCNSCLNVLDSNDVIEIDAASNNGVDEIRDLREKANLVPSSSKYKVYIIDEVHMLTTQAFNALLKTLEEPPKHVIFILATTEYYKIPLTITSRCQKFQFNKISVENIISRLREIANLEKIDIDDDAIAEIAKISDGGMRDSINFLDQLRSFSSKRITVDDVYNVCGNVSSQEIVNLFVDMRNNNALNVTSFFEKMDVTGKNYSKFIEDVITFLKDVVLYKNGVVDKYIKNNIDNVKKVADLFSLNTIFYIIDCVNSLIEKLSYVSRQSVVVIANFLLMVNKINCNLIDKNNEVCNDNNNVDNNSFIHVSLTSDKCNDDSKQSDKSDVVLEKKEVYEFSKTPDYVVKNKSIIINNAFALANKERKNILQEKFKSISDYLTDKKFNMVAGSLVDTYIEVAADHYLILSTKNNLVVDKIYADYKLCIELLNKLFNGEYNFVVVTVDEWHNYRDEYISNTRSGKKYEVMELTDNDNCEIVMSKDPTIVDKLFELVGEYNIEFK